ncbi:MAG: DUF1501 domain-containing protein [Opitutaceae bacterium]|nr:DUF1501 domain-containing protein [Opitutaceae bacterium]
MNNTLSSKLPATRREFLRMGGSGIGLLAFSRFAPAFLVQSSLNAAPAPEKDRTILVLIQLAGGNDGLNTVVPYEDANYYRLRPTLGLKKKDVLPINDLLGFHPSCAPLGKLVTEGKLGIVQNVGYPNPNRSHFRSTEIWESASDSDKNDATGWIGRYLDNTCAGRPDAKGGDPVAVNSGNEVPQSFLGENPHPTFTLSGNLRRAGRRDGNNLSLLKRLAESDHAGMETNEGFLRATMMDALVTEQRIQALLGRYKTESKYPASQFAQSLKNVAALIAAGLSTRVYFVSLGSFDTHAGQQSTHERLLTTLSEGMAAFQHDIDAKGLGPQVLTMTFSEFGRRPSENKSNGTDHGTAAPLFVMGSKIKGSLHGTSPKLDLPVNQDLTFSTDFRQIYSTVLNRWLDCPADKILGQKFDPLNFI